MSEESYYAKHARERGETPIETHAMFITFSEGGRKAFLGGTTYDMSEERDQVKFVQEVCTRAEFYGRRNQIHKVLDAIGLDAWAGQVSVK